MNSYTPDDKIALKRHLYPQREKEGRQYFSAFVAALRDARKATLRDKYGRRGESAQRHSSWLGAMGYMALLDQIGKCFKPTFKQKEPENNNIRKALKYFSNLSDDEIDAIYALRCAFAHDFALSNIYNDKRNKPHPLTRRFSVVASNGPLVTPSRKQWEGEFQSDDVEAITIVNLVALGDVVEEVVAKVRQLFRLAQLELVLRDGVNELKRRYALCSW